MSYRIEIRRLRVYAYHGVGSQEAVVGNDFEVDATLDIDRPAAIDTDSIADTINYAEVVELIKEEMKDRSQTLEHVAGRICRRIKDTYPTVITCRVTVWKICPPITANLERIGFTIES